MAWQLIYTSAPRLLEAGRSGFGTVARHRGISNLLVGAIERISQFSRLPGLADHRIIYSHRHISISGVRYHVISRISDAGADYTGRTNHIAHHLIIDPKEIANSPVTPADVLLSFAWRTGWTEIPCYLDVATEVSLASMQPKVRLPAHCWGRAAGNKRYASLLVGSEVSRGCYLVYPHDPNGDPLQQQAVHLFGESLLLTGGRAWSFPFTTNLQPSDDATDFLWSGVWTSSPVRTQVEQSERTIFSLALGGIVRNGSSGPAPVPTGPAADFAETGQSAVIEPPKPAAAVTIAGLEAVVPEQPFAPKVSEPKRAATIGPAPARNKVETRQFATPAPRKRRLWIPVVAVLGLIVVIWSGGYWVKKINGWRTSSEHWKDVNDVLKVLPGHTDSDADDLINAPGGDNVVEINTIKRFISNWESDLVATEGPKCVEIRSDYKDLQSLEKPESLRNLVAHVGLWLNIHDKVVKFDLMDKDVNDSGTRKKYDEYADFCTKIDDLERSIGPNSIGDALLTCNARNRCEFLLTALKNMRPAVPSTWFEEKLAAIRKRLPPNREDRDPELSSKLDQLAKTLALWEALEASEKSGSPIDGLKNNRFQDTINAPPWIVSAIKDLNTKQTAAASKPADENGAKKLDTNAKEKPLVVAETIDDEVKNGTMSIYIVFGDDALSGRAFNLDTQALQQLSLLKNGTQFLLKRQDKNDKYLRLEKMWFQTSDGGKLAHVDPFSGEKQPLAPFILEGNTPGSTTKFQIRVMGSGFEQGKDAKPLEFTGGLLIGETDKKDQITLDKNFSKISASLIIPPDAKLKLKLPAGFDPFAKANSRTLLPFPNYAADVTLLDDLAARKKALEDKLKSFAAAGETHDPFESFAPIDPTSGHSIKERSDAIYNHVCSLSLTAIKKEVLTDQSVTGLQGITDATALYQQLVRINSLFQRPPVKPEGAKDTPYNADVAILKSESEKWTPALPKCLNLINAVATKASDAGQQKEYRERLDSLNKSSLLVGKLPGGPYTVVVIGEDGRTEIPLIEFNIPNPWYNAFHR